MKRLPSPPYSRRPANDRGIDALVIATPTAWEDAERKLQWGTPLRHKLAILPPGKTPGDYDWSGFAGYDVTIGSLGISEGERALAVALILAGARMVLIIDQDWGPQRHPMEVFRPRLMEAAA